MSTDTRAANGVIRGRTVVLDDDVALPEGSRVTVELIPAADSEADKRARLYRRLEAEGALSVPKAQPSRIRRPRPVHVRGKPLSQTIIEDRR